MPRPTNLTARSCDTIATEIACLARGEIRALLESLKKTSFSSTSTKYLLFRDRRRLGDPSSMSRKNSSIAAEADRVTGISGVDSSSVLEILHFFSIVIDPDQGHSSVDCLFASSCREFELDSEGLYL
jgi:hypothetical protein